MRGLAGSVAIVTGGEWSEMLSADGAKVVLVDRDREAAEAAFYRAATSLRR